MKKLKLYTIEDEYVTYLGQFDNNVMHQSGSSYKHARKYIGVVLNINGYKYFAPLSSPKNSDYLYMNGKRCIRRSSIPIIRLITSDNVLLGKIKLDCMIPVPDECLSLYDHDNESDTNYKNLIAKEIICIRRNKKEIFKNAEILYNQKTNGYNNISYLRSTVNFKDLETACDAFANNKKGF